MKDPVLKPGRTEVGRTILFPKMITVNKFWDSPFYKEIGGVFTSSYQCGNETAGHYCQYLMFLTWGERDKGGL